MVTEQPRHAAESSRSCAEEWEAELNAAYAAALEGEALDADAIGAEWILALDDWERWPRIERFGSRSALLLIREL